MKTTFAALLLGFITVSYGQSLNDAKIKTENERYADALIDFKSLVSKEPVNGDNYFYYGDCYFEKGEVDSAILIWKKGYEVDKLTPMPYVGYGRVLWIQGNKAGAQLEFTKAFDLTKKNKVKRAEVIRGIAEIYIKSTNKDLDQAILLLDEAILKDPSNEDNHLLKGDALYAKTPQDASPAIKSYNQVLVINPKSPRGIVRVANIYQAAQNFELANQKYKESKAIDSTYAPAYRESAELYMRFDKMKLAIEEWKKYLALNNNLESRYRYANAMHAAKQYCAVVDEVNYLNANGLTNFYTERFLATAYLGCTDIQDGAQKGLEASIRFFEIAPKEKVNYNDYKTKGDLLSKLGKDSLALIELEYAAAMSESAAKELTGDIAIMYQKQKRFDKAIETFIKRRAITDLTILELYKFGQCYYAGPKDFIQADTIFAQVTILSPDYAPAYMWRARCQFQLDPKNEKWLAQPFYAKVIEIVKVEDRTLPANKKMVIESARYLCDYYSKSKAKDLELTKKYYQIIYDIDPNDAQAKLALGIKG